ncbi:hypothetical protein [Phenylobacterium sp.]|nr:hypothetical protein [Phenylobacterium sp.]
MTTDCLDTAQLDATARRLHDAVVGFAIAVIFVVPVVLGAFAFL